MKLLGCVIENEGRKCTSGPTPDGHLYRLLDTRAEQSSVLAELFVSGALPVGATTPPHVDLHAIETFPVDVHCATGAMALSSITSPCPCTTMSLELHGRIPVASLSVKPPSGLATLGFSIHSMMQTHCRPSGLMCASLGSSAASWNRRGGDAVRLCVGSFDGVRLGSVLGPLRQGSPCSCVHLSPVPGQGLNNFWLWLVSVSSKGLLVLVLAVSCSPRSRSSSACCCWFLSFPCSGLCNFLRSLCPRRVLQRLCGPRLVSVALEAPARPI